MSETRLTYETVYSVVQHTAALTARGFVRFVNIRPGRRHHSWVCDECFQSVPPAQQPKHAKGHSA